MRALRAWALRLLNVVRGRGPDRAFDAELHSLFEMHVDEQLRAGLPPAEAERQARLALGSIPAIVEAHRDRRGAPRLESIARDAHYALRGLRRQPGFAFVAILILGLGTGVTSALFSVVHAVLLAPLPYAAPERLVVVWTHNPSVQSELSAMSAANALDLQRGVTSFSSVEAFQANVIPAVTQINGATVAAQGMAVTPGMFATLGRAALIGRAFQPDDEPGVIVLSHTFWQRQFGGDPRVVGQRLSGADSPLVAGVMPADFTFPYPAMLRASVSFIAGADIDFWTPMTPPREPNRSLRIIGLIGRLKADTTLDAARADVDVAWQQLVQAHPSTNAGWRARVEPLHDQAVGNVATMLWLLFAGVGLVLLIACVNVASLLVARGVARQRELAMRQALGADRARLVQQVIVDGLVLTALGAAAGLLFARWAVPVIVQWAPAGTPRLHEVGISWTVLLFACALALACGLAVSAAPALGLARLATARTLADGARGASDSRRRLRSVLVAAEVALAVVLTVGAGLLVRSFMAVLAIDPGFRVETVLSLGMNVPGRYTTPASRLEFYRQLFERLEAVPGVQRVGGTTRLPLGGANSTTTIAVEGREPAEGEWLQADLRRALHDYFDTMGIPLRRGRGFTADDRAGSAPVAIVNETLARTLFGAADPIGQRVRLGSTSPVRAATIVGVVGDLRHERMETLPAPEVYVHYMQGPPVAPILVVRASGDPAALAPAVRAAMREFDAQLEPYNVQTLSALRWRTLAGRGFVLSLAAAFGVLALVLAALGVYGVTALMVHERRREMGVRLALGAPPRLLLQHVIGRAMTITGAGAAAGLIAALALTPAIRSHLFAIGPADPITLAAVLATLLLTAAAAAWLPARRALRADPAESLRD